MEVNAEARRILAVSVSKLYASRSQRGGMRLHRSLLLSLVMRSARDIYHSSRESETPPAEPMETGRRAETDSPVWNSGEPNPEVTVDMDEGRDCETSEDKENASPARASRKRRGKASAAPDFLPSKRARLECGEERYAAPLGSCRAGDCLAALTLNRVIPAF
ncbi:immediate early response 2b [Synchiropus splendidus]|uniref:immediate early response 2b n=1 Tax=Synchiropus splendidus TaxID=270530 RepID=UPI00237E2CA2|nr:immediate early response 2b [Synchiropus splendidus]